MNLLTIGQVAKRLGITRGSVWYHVRQKRIPVTYLGPLAIISEGALQEFQSQWKRRRYPSKRNRR